MRKIRIVIIILACLEVTGIKAQPLVIDNHHSVIVEMDDSPDQAWMLGLLLARPEISVRSVLLHTDKQGTSRDMIGEICRILGHRGLMVYSLSPSGLCHERQQIIDALKETPGEKKRPVYIYASVDDISRGCEFLDSAFRQNFQKLIFYSPGRKEMYRWLNDPAFRIDVIALPGDQGLAEPASDGFDRLPEKTSLMLVSDYIYKVTGTRPSNKGAVLAAVYLTNPELFDMQPDIGHTSVRQSTDYASGQVSSVVNDMIHGTYYPADGIVLNRFPLGKEFYAYDVREIMDSTISRFGPEEWKACVMTDEIHGHLGVFSIVGAKMGILAREYFGVGRDQLEVLSFAGSVPPYSCMNDGLQSSTGATLGIGTIKLSPDTLTAPSAVFSCRGKKVRITLRNQYLEQVEADISEGIARYGLMDDGYWKLVRRSALRYWSSWNRNEIFVVEGEDAPPE